MVDFDDDDDDVGYGKPPKHRQFQKGCSGNPKGRPRRTRNLATRVHDAWHAKVPIKDNSGWRKIEKIDASLMQLSNKSAAGDIKATQAMIAIYQATGAGELSQRVPVTQLTQLIVEFVDPIDGRPALPGEIKKIGDDDEPES